MPLRMNMELAGQEQERFFIRKAFIKGILFLLMVLQIITIKERDLIIFAKPEELKTCRAKFVVHFRK